MPHDGDFFVLFQKQAENIVAGAHAFTKMLEHYTGVPEQVQIIKAIEHNGDEITHQIFRKLNRTFITPFDREDIHELCSTMDDVIDLIDAAASRFVLYRVDSIRTGTVELVTYLPRRHRGAEVCDPHNGISRQGFAPRHRDQSP